MMRLLLPPRRRTYHAALITGATSGIGEAFARSLPERTGLVLVGRRRERLETLGAELARPGRTIATVAVDLTTDEGRTRVIEAGEAAGLDLLVNNAGVGRLGRLVEHDPADERAMVELNVTTPLVLTRGLLPGMLARARAQGRRAGLIMVASEAAFAPVPFFATYAASKAFDLVLAESLAEELRGERIDVLALCPGATRTGFGRQAGFAPGNLPGAQEPHEVAEAALRALGRQTVLVTGRAQRAALAPVVLSRALATRGLGAMMTLALRWQDPAKPGAAPRAQRGTMPQ